MILLIHIGKIFDKIQDLFMIKMINQLGLEGNILNLTKVSIKNPTAQDFPVGPVVKNLPAKCRGHGFDPWSRKIPHALGQLSPSAPVTEPTHSTARDPHREATTLGSPHAQPEKSLSVHEDPHPHK